MDNSRSQINKIVERINSLLAMTIENSCTESESTVAAAKIAKIIEGFAKSDRNLDLNDIDQAIALCSKAISQWHGHAELHCARGGLYTTKGFFRDGLADLYRARYLQPEETDASYGLVTFHFVRVMEVGDGLLAPIRPATSRDCSARGSLYMLTGNFDAAISDLNMAIQLDPETGENWRLRGVAHRKQEDFELALADLNESIRLDPSNMNAYISRGVTYEILEKYDLAKNDYIAVASMPNDPPAIDVAHERIEALSAEIGSND